MTTKSHNVNSLNRRRSFESLAVLGAIGLSLAATHCADEPKVRCTLTSGEAIAKYELIGTPTGTCNNVTLPTKAEPVGVQSFVPSPADANAADKVNGIAIKPVWIGDRIADARDAIESVDDQGAPLNPDLQAQSAVLLNYPYGTDEPPAPPPDGPPTTKFPYAFGKFDSVFPDGAGVCTASSVAPSELTYPVIPKHVVPDPDDPTNTLDIDEQPATTVKYAWSNFRALVSADSIGTQAFADLAITRDGCSANYKVAILYPLVDCSTTDATGATVGNEAACDPNPTDENFYGSGIGVGIDTKCEDVGTGDSPSFVCVPTKMEP